MADATPKLDLERLESLEGDELKAYAREFEALGFNLDGRWGDSRIRDELFDWAAARVDEDARPAAEPPAEDDQVDARAEGDDDEGVTPAVEPPAPDPKPRAAPKPAPSPDDVLVVRSTRPSPIALILADGTHKTIPAQGRVEMSRELVERCLEHPGCGHFFRDPDYLVIDDPLA